MRNFELCGERKRVLLFKRDFLSLLEDKFVLEMRWKRWICFLKRKRLKRLLNFENFWWMGNISALFLNITFFSQMCSQDLSGMRWKRLIWFKEKKPQKQIKFEIFWWTGFIYKLKSQTMKQNQLHLGNLHLLISSQVSYGFRKLMLFFEGPEITNISLHPFEFKMTYSKGLDGNENWRRVADLCFL